MRVWCRAICVIPRFSAHESTVHSRPSTFSAEPGAFSPSRSSVLAKIRVSDSATPKNVAVFHRDKRVVVDDDRYTFTLDLMNFSEVLELHEYEINVRRYEVFETLTQPDP